MRLLLAFCLCLIAPIANAIVVEIDTLTPNAFAFTVDWGPEQSWNGATIAQVSRPDVSGTDVMGWVFVFAGEEVQGSDHLDRLDIDVHTGFPSGQTQATIHFPASPTDVSFGSAWYDLSPFGLTPTITPTADGFGARFVYDAVEPGTGSVPDTGSALALLGMGACGVLILRRLT